MRPVRFKTWIADERTAVWLPFGNDHEPEGPDRSTWVTLLPRSPHTAAWFAVAIGAFLPRKEVIQPQLPLRLPCYDFVPIAGPTLDGCLLAVSPPASGVTNFHDVTGGVYKARERIQRSNADLRLLATPASCRRVSACNPN